ncbi:MAG: Mu transposase C-terminal domain-containing protein [Rhodospirillales bacterium]|nr:Mu transposase C-terminal domain-containing protein [Rhodospirillales bacterium]
MRRVHDERALDALLAEPASGGWRTVRKAGIRLENADYIAGELGPLVGELVCVRRDAADTDRLYVYLACGAFVCVAEEARPARRLSGRARTIGSQHCPRC